MFDVCVIMYVSFHICVGIDFVDWFEKGFTCIKRVLEVCLLTREFEHPEVTLCG